MTPRRARFWILVALLAGLPLIGAGAAFVWIHRVADQRWAAAEERIRQLSAAFPKEERPRAPSAENEAAKENQIHFVAAIRAAAPTRGTLTVAWKLILEKKTGEELNEVLAEAQEFLDRLHQGGRRIAASPSDFPPRWHGDWDYDTITYMSYCAVLRSRQLRERKQMFEAAETLMDSLQLARFWAISGQEINRYRALLRLLPLLDELRDILQSEVLSTDNLRALERELEPLDEAMRSPLTGLEGQLARMGDSLQTMDLQESGMMDWAPYRWRFLLPPELMKAQAFEFMDRQVQEMLNHADQGYPELLRLSQRAAEEAEQSRNPIIQRTGSLVSGNGLLELERKAQLRLLRVAASYRATGLIPDLSDPFGSSIRHAEDGPRIKFWSLGRDGRDDGGDVGSEEGWHHVPIPGVASLPPKDIVIEVPRRP